MNQAMDDLDNPILACTVYYMSTWRDIESYIESLDLNFALLPDRFDQDLHGLLAELRSVTISDGVSKSRFTSTKSAIQYFVEIQANFKVTTYRVDYSEFNGPVADE